LSSGDGHARKAYISPRAAFGRRSRVPEPLIFVSGLVAFFNVHGWSQRSQPASAADRWRGEFFGFSRTAFGIVKTRTDGKRLLVYTDSGKVAL